MEVRMMRLGKLFCGKSFRMGKHVFIKLDCSSLGSTCYCPDLNDYVIFSNSRLVEVI